MSSAGAPALDAPLLKAPFERLKQCTKDRKAMVEEVTAVVDSLAPFVDPATVTPHGDPLEHLDSMISQLNTLKRKMEETSEMEVRQLEHCRARLSHLTQLAEGGEGTPRMRADKVRWGSTPPRGLCHSSQLLDRLLADHLLRCGYYDAALQLAQSSGITELLDLEVFEAAQVVVRALRAHDCGAALHWCQANADRLKKLKSKLEFQLRRREFLELVKSGGQLEAIQYARQHLAPHAEAHLSELQPAMATLIFTESLLTSPYKHFFEEAQWTELIHTFQAENHRINHLTLESLLTIYLQAGLSALKTPFSLQPNCSVEDPLHLESFRKLAEGLPFSKHIHSKLVCHITKELMNEDNPPMVLPNGYVYSLKAMEEMSKKNDGKLVCPRTGFKCEFSNLVKAFVS